MSETGREGNLNVNRVTKMWTDRVIEMWVTTEIKVNNKGSPGN
jgi:hypothetical protein